MIEIRKVSVYSKDAEVLLQELNESLEKITGTSGAKSFDLEDATKARSVFLIAYQEKTPVGCGSLREVDDDTAEMKRVYARPNKSGVGSRLLNILEENAKELGYKNIILETRKVNVTAVAFYQKNGYEICPNYGKYVGRTDAVCFLKQIL